MLKKLDRRFDTSDVEAYLPTAARHILEAFYQIKRWVASRVPLFAHAFLIKPLSNHLREAMSQLQMPAESNSEEQLWKEHARMLSEIEVQQDRIHDALEMLVMHQRQILRGQRRFA